MYLCYLLQSVSRPSYTYIGITNNIVRRVRQHNGEIKGGAKYTRANRPWRLVCHVSGFPTKSNAMQFEWAWKHIKSRRINGRLKSLTVLLQKERWTRNSPLSNTFMLVFTKLINDVTFPVELLKTTDKHVEKILE